MMVTQQFPMGIDSDRFFRALETPKVRECINELTEKFSGCKVGVVFHFSAFFLFLCDTCQKYVLQHLFHTESHLGNCMDYEVIFVPCLSPADTTVN